MLHELAHVLDYRSRFPGSGYLERNADLRESRIADVAEGRQSIRDLGFSRSAAWQRAIEESPCAVSEYAMTNEREDFAESVSAWLLYFRLGAAIRDPGRFRVTDPFEDWNRWYDEHYSLTKAELAEYRRVLQERLGRRFGILQRVMHGRFAPFPEVPPS
ncbi:MAG: hypothetical protein OXI73_01640 [Rhodospirillales bacterium]|nr:hypothetical protein [Rhodospirillales bacterium]